jgi:hypothetical protein
MVRPLKLPNHKDEPVESKPPATPKGLNLPTTPIKSDPPVEQRKTKSLNIGEYVPPQRVVKRTDIDDYIDKALKIDSTITPLEIRAKISSAMTKTIEGLLTWGDHNLIHIQAASNLQTRIASRMNQINAAGWLKDAMDASCKKPTKFGNIFSAPASPEYYDSMLRKTQDELMQIVQEATTIEKNYSIEIRDLQLDGISLMVVLDNITDTTDQMIANNRVKSIMAAHQTGVMLLETMKQIKLQCADYIQRIDDFRIITLPNWKIAFQRK